MLKKLIILVVFVFMSISAYAQVDTAWIRSYNGWGDGGDLANDITVDASGNVYVTGYSWGNYNDYASIKYDRNGNALWIRRYSGAVGYFDDNAEAIAVDASGNVYVTGGSNSGGATSYDYATIKYKPNGDTAWVRRYNGPANSDDYALDLAVDGSGNVYVTGESPGNGTNRDYATVKYFPNGDTAWVRMYNGAGNGADGARAIAVDDSGNVCVTGWSYQGSLRTDYVTIKYYPNGNTAWVRKYGFSGSNIAYAIAVDHSCNVYITGQSYGIYADFATIKYYPNGDTAWTRRYNGAGANTDEAYAIAVDGSGNVYVTGRSTGSGTDYDYATIKYDSSGTRLWVASYNGPGSSADKANAIAVDDSGNVYVTGESYGVDYDYATVKYDQNGNERWVERYNSGHDGDEAHAIVVDAYGNVYVTGGGYDYATIKYGKIGGEKILVLRDGSDSLNPIASKTFKIYKVTDDPPVMTESYLGELTTNAYGRMTVPEGWFNIGDWVKVERLVHSEPAVKHRSILPNMYYIKIDNGTFDSTTGAISYHTFTSDSLQEITLSHATVMFDLLVSVEWDADQQYLESLRDGFKLMSNYLYDVTDGQLYIDSVKIFDAKAYWDSSDVRIYASNMQWPNASTFTWTSGAPRRLGGGIFGSGERRLYFPRIFYFNSYNGNRNLTYDLYPYDWIISQTTYDDDNDGSIDYPDEFKAYPPSRTLAHEFGHYGVGFRDEYINNAGNNILDDFDFGLMDDQLGVDIEQNSEMSCLLQYDVLSHRITRQWVNRGDRSCWDYFEWNYEGTYDGIFVPIKKPSTELFSGPNNDMLNLNYDVGSLLRTVISDSNTGAYVLIFTSTDELGSPLGNSKVQLYKDNHTWFIDQGNTADSGSIICLGVNGDDIIRAFRDTLYLEIELNILGSYKENSFRRVSANGNTIVAILRAIKGNYLMLNSGWFQGENSFRYSLQVNKSFSQNPSLELYNPYNQMYTYVFSPVTEGYESIVGNSLGSDGMFSVIAVDDSAYTFFVNNRYTVTPVLDSSFVPEIYGPQGSCILNLDEDNSSLHKILILSSDFPPLLNGLDSLVEQGGEVHSISAYPNLSSLAGVNNYIVIKYQDVDLKSSSETSLKIFKWNETSNKWEFIGGTVDTTGNEVVCSIHSLGIYAAFTTALLRGDVNSDRKLTVSDVVYLINYLFKGGPAPVAGLLIGDVNCDGRASVADVVYLINYLFKGGPKPAC